MKRKVIVHGLQAVLLALAFLSSLAWAAKPLFIAKNDIPPGFENLGRPQRSLVDIYYGNRYIVSQLVTYTPYKVTLSNPAQVLELIGDIASPLAVEEALTGKLDLNSSEVCLSASRQNCGILEPEVAGVIFDESRFRLDVFINPSLLLTRAAEVSKYLPPSEAGLAWLNSFSGAYSGTTGGTDDSDDFTLNGVSLLSYGENSLYTNWNYSKTQHARIDDFYLQREFEGQAWRGGLLSTRGFGLSFTSSQTLYGVNLSSSDNTRLDTEFTGGTSLDVFLPVRGRVEVRRDGRLLKSWFLEAGSQELDTRSFPDGAYDIEIRIIDELGNEVSRKTEFFAKQYSLPPEGEWRYFIESGRVLSRAGDDLLPDTTSQWLIRGGVSRRLLDTLGGTVAIAANRDDALIEGGLFLFGRGWELSPSLMMATDGSYGLNINGRARLGVVSANMNYRHLWRDNDFSLPAEDIADSLLGDAFEQGSVSFSAPVADGSLSYRYSYSDRLNQGSTNTNSLDYRKTFLNSPDYSLDGSLGISHQNDTTIFQTSMTLRMNDGRWNYRAQPRFDYTDGATGSGHSARARLSASWRDEEMLAGDLKADVGTDLGEDDTRYDAQLQYSNTWGRADLSVNHARNNNGSSATSYSASFSSSVLTNGEIVAVGGEDRSESAVVVMVNGLPGDQFDVRVNGQRRGYAVAGRPSVISLSPYEQYRITVTAPKGRLYDFDERIHEVTLYPGNVMTLELEAIPMQLVFGRFTLHGKPVVGARIEGGRVPVRTDDLGLYQVDIPFDKQKMVVQLPSGEICKVTITRKQKDIVRMGTRALENEYCAG